MVKSPFPGMDPFLEHDWLDFHASLTTYIRDQIQDHLPADLVARMESRVLIDDEVEDEQLERHPDVRVIEAQRGRSDTAVLESPAKTAGQPDMYLVHLRREPETQRYIEIVDAQTRTRVVTAIELISPSNKLPGIGQKLYLKKRQECLNADVNFVEIDLTRRGNRRALLPGLAEIYPPPTYAAWVWRATDFDQVALYFFPLYSPLKPMRIPLRTNDEDAVLQLQPLIEQAYQRGRYDRLDYTRPLDPPLSGEDAAFAEKCLHDRINH